MYHSSALFLFFQEGRNRSGKRETDEKLTGLVPKAR